MTIISKAALAAEIGVSKSRVSQYLNAGLPERSDGKLDREVALDWLSLNARSGADHRKGPSRARTLRPPIHQPARSLGDAEATRRARVQMAGEVVYGVMSMACDLELPMRVVYALVMNMQHYCSDIVGGEGLDYLHPQAIIRDWESIAGGQDEPYDLVAWEAYRAEMYAKAG